MRKQSFTAAAILVLAVTTSPANAEFVFRHPHGVRVSVAEVVPPAPPVPPMPPDTEASVPVLSVTSTASGTVGAAIPLAIDVFLTDWDGSETLSVRVSGLPAGTTLSAGTADGVGAWLVPVYALPGLSVRITTPGSYSVLVVATTTEENGGATASASRTIALSVSAG